MEIGNTFCGRTDGRTEARTHLSSNLLGHDLKIGLLKVVISLYNVWLGQCIRTLALEGTAYAFTVTIMSYSIIIVTRETHI